MRALDVEGFVYGSGKFAVSYTQDSSLLASLGN
jgi:hypothetical protein